MRLLLFVLTGLSLVIIGTIAAGAPPMEAKRLGLRGLKRQRALENIPIWASLEPLVRWLSARFAGLLSGEQRRSLNRKLALAGDFMGFLPEEVVGFSILTSLVGGAVGYFLGLISGMGNLILIVGFMVGAAMPFMRISSTAADRMKFVSRRLPSAIDLLSLSMGAGLDFPGAVRQVVDKTGAADDAVVEEFTLILQSLQLGRTRRAALGAFSERVPVDAVLEFTGAMIQAELRGNPVVEVLRIQAEVARRKRTVRAEESAAKAGAAMMGPLVLVFLAIMILIIAPIIMKIQLS
jgi:tight adherence protein C